MDFFRPKLDEVLSGWGYTDWEINQVDRLEADHCSGYIERLVREARGAAQ